MSVNKNSKPPHAAEGIAGRMPDNKNSKSPHAAEGIAGRVSVNNSSKPPHAAEGIAGRMPDNKNSKSPHAAEGIAGRVSALDIKAEWFFHETRSGARQQWAEDRKATRPKLRDPDFLAENAARGGMAASKERQLLADFENELDQVFVQLPKYAVAALTAGGDNFFFSLSDPQFCPVMMKSMTNTMRVGDSIVSLLTPP